MADQHDHGPGDDRIVARHLEPQAEEHAHRAKQNTGPQLLDAPCHVVQPRAAPAGKARDPQARQGGEAHYLGGEVHPKEQDKARGRRRHAGRNPAHRIDYQAADEQHRQQRGDQHESHHRWGDRAQPSADGLRPGLIDATPLHLASLPRPGLQ